MPGDDIEVIQICQVCNGQLGSFIEKKEKLMLSTIDYLWCEACQVTAPTRRDIGGREASVAQEIQSYPQSAELSRDEGQYIL